MMSTFVCVLLHTTVKIHGQPKHPPADKLRNVEYVHNVITVP